MRVEVFLYILVMAAVTYLIRMLPLTLIRRKNHEPHTALVSLLCAVRHAFRHDLPGNSHRHRQRHQRRARLCRRFDFSIPR